MTSTWIRIRVPRFIQHKNIMEIEISVVRVGRYKRWSNIESADDFSVTERYLDPGLINKRRKPVLPGRRSRDMAVNSRSAQKRLDGLMATQRAEYGAKENWNRKDEERPQCPNEFSMSQEEFPRLRP